MLKKKKKRNHTAPVSIVGTLAYIGVDSHFGKQEKKKKNISHTDFLCDTGSERTSASQATSSDANQANSLATS